MLNRRILFIVLLTLFQSLLFVSCTNEQVDSSDIKIWTYQYELEGTYKYYSDVVSDAIEEYGNKNNLSIELIIYSPETLSYDDYVLKRNIAIETSEVDMILDNLSGLMNIREKSINYEILSTVESLVPALRNSFAVPLAYDPPLMLVDRSIYSHYGIAEKEISSKGEWYELKQTLKKNGAEIELNYHEMIQLIDYYLISNNVYDKLADDSIGKELSYSVSMILKDISEFYKPEIVNNKFFIYDKNIGREILVTNVKNSLEDLSNIDFDDKYSVLFDEELVYMRNRYGMLCMFIPNGCNENILGLSDYLLSESIQLKLCGGSDYKNGNLPVNHDVTILQSLNIGDDYRVFDEKGIKNIEQVNLVLEKELNYMRKTGIPLVLAEDNSREFLLFGVYEIIEKTLEGDYNEVDVQTSIEKLRTDYKLYYKRDF